MGSSSSGGPTPPNPAPPDCGAQDPGSSYSGYPVRYGNGEIKLTEVDLSYNGLGIPWGQTRSYDNILNPGYDGPTGINWFTTQIPYLEGDGGLLPATILVVTSPNNSLIYNWDGTSESYVPQYYQQDTLVFDGAANQFVLTSAGGRQYWYYGFDAGVKAGLLRAIVDPAGNIIPLAYDSLGRVVSIGRTFGDQETGFYYTYVDGTSAQLASVTIQVNGTDQRQASYSYYAEGSENGLPGDLETAVIADWNTSTSAWDTIKTSYYRYYIADGSGGFEHGLQYALGGEAYAEMVAADLTPETATDEELAEYADYYFEYDTSNRVTTETVKGGAYTYNFAYENGVTSSDFNQWTMKTTETLPDSSENIVYTNTYTQPLFKIYQSGSSKWYTWYNYDDSGNLLQRASSSAISGYSESNPSVATLNESSGLIDVWEYYGADDPDGNPEGYLENVMAQEGSGGTPVALKNYAYTSQTCGSQTIYPVFQVTIYQSTSGTLSPAVTEYDYEWYPGTFQKSQVTTTWPTITTGQNGSDTSNSRTTVLDVYGNPTWVQDERGFLTNYTNDPLTGAVIEQIQDVNTDILPAPNGWTTPTGGGLHLISDYEVDIFGRRTQSLGPVNTIDLSGTATTVRRAQWTIYQDVLHAVWRGSGYATGSGPDYTYTLINPGASTICVTG